MKLSTLHEVIGRVQRLQTLANAEVARHDKGPEHEPSSDMVRALGQAKLCAEVLALLEAERVMLVGDVRWFGGH